MIKSIVLIPIDINSILREKIKHISDENIIPVSWSEFIQIEKEVKEILNSIIKTHLDDKEISNLILINYKVFIELSNFLFNLLVFERGKSKICFSESSKYYSGFKFNRIPGKTIITPPKRDKLSIKRKLKNKLKWIKLFLKLNKLANCFYVLRRDYVLFESSSEHTFKYLKKERKSLKVPLNLSAIIDRKINNANEFDINYSKINYVVDLVSDKFSNLGLKYNLILKSSQENYIKDVVRNVFESSSLYYEIFNKYLCKKHPMNLFIASNNNMILRAFTTAVRNNKGNTAASTHGEPLIYNWDKIAWMELSLVDKYFDYTEKLKESLKKITINFPPPNNNRIKIEHFNSSFFDKIRIRYNNVKVLYPKSVMFVANEYVREGELSQVSSFPNSIQFDFEQRLISFLAKKFTKVFYKKHPGGVFNKKSISFFPPNIEVIEKPFEEVLNFSETFIFGHSRTTTFGSVLSLNKKVILCLGDWEYFEDSIFDELKKQIYLINYTEKNNRLFVNLDELDFILDSNESKPIDFYNKFLKG